MASKFRFVRDTVLREGIERVFDHIVDLLALSESSNYSDLAKSSFRKTVIIHTASVIEALLLHLVRTACEKDDLVREQWILKDRKILHEIDSMNRIVAGKERKVIENVDPDTMNLGQINIFLRDKNVISETLSQKIDRVRVLRNEQHLGTNKQLKEYSRTDLEFVFSVAKKVKESCERKAQ